jgi:hypothetical protein
VGIARVWLAAGRDWSAVVREIPVLAIATLALLVPFYTLAFVLSTRREAIAHAIKKDQPEGIVFTSGRTPDLPPALKRVGYEEQAEMRAKDLPLSLCIVGNAHGVAMWGGSPKQPYEYFHVPWSSVATVTSADIYEFGRTTRGLNVVVHDKSGLSDVALPFIVTGRGPGGLFAQPRLVIEGILRELLSLKEAAAAATSKKD